MDSHAVRLSLIAPPADAYTGIVGVLGTGSVLADRYRLVRRIGGGGMGSVWEAEHLALGTPVAIKLIHASLIDDESARSRFVREARAAATLRSAHVVQIHDYGVHERTPYIAMELLDGEPLSERLARKGRLPPAEVLDVLTQVGRAVAKAHEIGVVHRDLKPDNIFLVPGEHGDIVKVLDFGIAKRFTEGLLDATTASGMVGTPFYMSPEQLVEPRLADVRADLWSLAVIAYECLLGTRPFAAASMPELAVAVLAEPVPVPSRAGAVPPGFDGWFERATRRDPSARFGSVGELLDALAPCLRAAPVDVAARPQSDPRERGSWIVVAGLAVAGLALAVWALRGRNHDTSMSIEPPTAGAEVAPAEPQPVAPAPAAVRMVAQPPSEPSTSRAPIVRPPTPEAAPVRRTTPKRSRERSGSSRAAERTTHDIDELEP